MMTFLSYLFSFLLILDCLILGLLVMIQLPKKEAGVGMAFGGGAADALFGAGSGTALTKLTKYCAVAFFVLVVVLCMIKNHSKSSMTPEFRRAYESSAPTQPVTPPSTTAPAAISNAPTLLISSNTATGPTFTTTATNATTNKPAAPVK
jgi:preprotein translocase subunit SecG